MVAPRLRLRPLSAPAVAACWRATLLVVLLAFQVCLAADEAEWPVCENRQFRDEDIEPGGLRLLGVKESPLGDFPSAPAAATHEHFFKQLREVWTDDCPRMFVQLGVQPAPGRFREWSSAALWLHYFNNSGMVVAVDAVSDYLEHFAEALRVGPQASLLSIAAEGEQVEGAAPGAQVDVRTVRALVAERGSGKKAKERPVSFDAPAGGKVLAADEAMRACSGEAAGPDAEDERHPCARILRGMRASEPLEYFAPLLTFDDIWKRKLKSRHADFLQVDLGAASMLSLLNKGFSNFFTARQASVFAFRVDELWTKADLKAVVEWLDKFEYFSMFKLVCSGSSQAGSFSYYGPGGDNIGPTTYLPVSGVDFDKAIDWDRLTLPQDVLAFDLRQPDIFRTVQLGDSSCDVDEGLDDETCAKDASGSCRGGTDGAAPGRPEQLRVVRSESRALTLEWRPQPGGATPETYTLRVDPGAMEDSIEHDGFEMASGVQMHTVGSLRPDTEYTIRLRAVGPGGESEEASVVHRTATEKAAAAASALYDMVEGLHCGMSSTEEVQPAGPPPQGQSFFRDIKDSNGCRARCDDNRQCVAFQVKSGDACWLYRRRPREAHLSGPRNDAGWECGVKK